MKIDVKEKTFLFDESHFNNIKEALELVYNVVSKTMGPAGSNVFIERKYLPPIITKDGATVAEHVEIPSSEYASVVNLIRNITREAAHNSGDGTTTTTVLSYSLFKYFIEEVASLEDTDRQKLRILSVTEHLRSLLTILTNILKDLSFEIKTKKELEDIIMISTNQDKYMTELLLECLEVKSDEDVAKAKNKDIMVSNSKNGKDYIENIRGSKYNSGYISNLFCNNNRKNKISVDDPYVFLSNSRINNMQELEFILTYTMQKKKPLVIIAPEFDQAVIATLFANFTKGVVITYPIQAPGSGGIDTENYMDDLAVSLGINCVKSGTAFSFDRITLENASIIPSIISESCTYFEADSSTFTIVSNGNDERIAARIKELEEEMDEDITNNIKKDSLKRRISKLRDGISNLYISANTDVELLEKRDRIDDAIGAIKSALSEGYVYGAGTTLLKLASIISVPEESDDINIIIASKILKKALEQPFMKIYRNAEVDSYILSDFKKQMRELISGDNIDINVIKKINSGIDINTEEIIDLSTKGIIDPTKVLRCALEYSISLVSTLISSSASILLNKENV